jgi:hypothetical protein
METLDSWTLCKIANFIGYGITYANLRETCKYFAHSIPPIPLSVSNGAPRIIRQYIANDRNPYRFAKNNCAPYDNIMTIAGPAMVYVNPIIFHAMCSLRPSLTSELPVLHELCVIRAIRARPEVQIRSYIDPDDFFLRASESKYGTCLYLIVCGKIREIIRRIKIGLDDDSKIGQNLCSRINAVDIFREIDVRLNLSCVWGREILDMINYPRISHRKLVQWSQALIGTNAQLAERIDKLAEYSRGRTSHVGATNHILLSASMHTIVFDENLTLSSKQIRAIRKFKDSRIPHALCRNFSEGCLPIMLSEVQSNEHIGAEIMRLLAKYREWIFANLPLECLQNPFIHQLCCAWFNLTK